MANGKDKATLDVQAEKVERLARILVYEVKALRRMLRDPKLLHERLRSRLQELDPKLTDFLASYEALLEAQEDEAE
jgi:hypothetical protein